MAFLSQLSGHLQTLKDKTVTMAEGAPAIGAHLQSLKVRNVRVQSSISQMKCLLSGRRPEADWERAECQERIAEQGSFEHRRLLALRVGFHISFPGQAGQSGQGAACLVTRSLPLTHRHCADYHYIWRTSAERRIQVGNLCEL